MYRWLLCLRYLRTRYIALASIISVTLGVGTLIVVNSVMAGFSAEMHERLHGIASDILIECHTAAGIFDPQQRLAEIEEIVGEDLVGTSVSVHVPAMMTFGFNGQTITRQVNLVGIDAETYDSVSDFGKYLLHPENRRRVAFELREDGYAPDRENFPAAGWRYRRARVAYERELEAALEQRRGEQPDATPAPADADDEVSGMAAAGPMFDPRLAVAEGQTPSAAPREFDPAQQTFPGIVLGIATCSVRMRSAEDEVQDHFYRLPGDDVQLMFPNAGDTPEVVNQKFTVVDLYESGMSEYDGSFAFVKLEDLQYARGMIDPLSGSRSVTTIQLKLAEGANLAAVRDKLRAKYPPELFAYQIQTWMDMQGPLLAAVQLETTILNILLFLIIAVAGFGILATFFMIVVEKTRDIGTLKALGASGSGVMSIFLSYGLLLGLVGSGVGLVGGVLFVIKINEIAGVIERLTGQEVFDPTIYYFSEIPTIIEPFTLCWVMAGAVLIATLASVLPAYRAARMHPVQALRYE